MSEFETILCEDAGKGVMRVTLNRSAQHNAINAAMIRELTEIAQRFTVERSLRVVVLAAVGSTFCAGGDLGWMKQQFQGGPEQRAAEAQALFRMFKSLNELPQMLIGVVHGPAYGGGVGLTAACDIVIASPEARFMLSETRLGLIPATIAPFLLRRIGPAPLRRIGLHGESIGAEQAQSIGLVSEVVPKDALETAVARHVAHALACAPGAIAAAKALYRVLDRGEAGERHATRALAERWQSEEAQAGIAAFFTKEAPPWQE